MIVRKIFPSRTARAVILADGSPLALGEIGSPTLPMFFSSACFFKPAVFCGLDSWHRWLILCGRVQLWSHFLRNAAPSARKIVPVLAPPASRRKKVTTATELTAGPQAELPMGLDPGR